MRFLKTQRCQPNWRGRLLRLEPLEDRRLLTIFAPTNGAQLAADLVIAESTGGSNTINLGATTYTLPSAPNVPSHGGTLHDQWPGVEQDDHSRRRFRPSFRIRQSERLPQGHDDRRRRGHDRRRRGSRSMPVPPFPAQWEAQAASARGGGMLIDGGRVTLSGCVLKSNRAVGGNGASGSGLRLRSLSRPTLPATAQRGNGGNGGNASGGAIFLLAGTLNICNSTISNNTAQGGAGGNGGNGARGLRRGRRQQPAPTERSAPLVVMAPPIAATAAAGNPARREAMAEMETSESRGAKAEMEAMAAMRLGGAIAVQSGCLTLNGDTITGNKAIAGAGGHGGNGASGGAGGAGGDRWRRWQWRSRRQRSGWSDWHPRLANRRSGRERRKRRSRRVRRNGRQWRKWRQRRSGWQWRRWRQRRGRRHRPARRIDQNHGRNYLQQFSPRRTGRRRRFRRKRRSWRSGWRTAATAAPRASAARAAMGVRGGTRTTPGSASGGFTPSAGPILVPERDQPLGPAEAAEQAETPAQPALWATRGLPGSAAMLAQEETAAHGGKAQGGGISVVGGTLTLCSATLSGNLPPVAREEWPSAAVPAATAARAAVPWALTASAVAKAEMSAWASAGSNRGGTGGNGGAAGAGGLASKGGTAGNGGNGGNGGDGGSASGGAVAVSGGNVWFTSVKITGNAATGGKGGLGGAGGVGAHWRQRRQCRWRWRRRRWSWRRHRQRRNWRSR